MSLAANQTGTTDTQRNPGAVMTLIAIKHNLAGILALACAIVVVLAIARDADAGLGPADPAAMSAKAAAGPPPAALP